MTVKLHFSDHLTVDRVFNAIHAIWRDSSKYKAAFDANLVSVEPSSDVDDSVIMYEIYDQLQELAEYEREDMEVLYGGN